MKNTIKETRAAEVKAATAAAEQAKLEEFLDKVEPVDMVGTMTQSKNGEVHACRDEDGNVLGANGGKYIQYPVNGMTTIAARNEEELAQIKERIASGITGDGMLHQQLIIGGIPCDCCGATIEELEADIRAARVYAKQHGYGVIRDIDVAEQLIEAGFEQEDLKVICDDYILVYSEKCIMDTAGNTIVDLNDIKSKLSKEDLEKLLTERLEAKLAEYAAECDECDDDYCDEDEDYCEEDED